MVSIPSNIAEGKLRYGNKEFKHFLQIALASGGELETQIELSKRLFKSLSLDYTKVDTLLLEVMKILVTLISTIAKKS